MRGSTRALTRRLLAGLALSTMMAASASGQGAAAFGGFGGQTALTPPRFEPEGLWARVVSATPKWLVLENVEGQQFPVSTGAVDLFVMRWPTNPLMAPPGTWAEVTGIDLNSGGVLAGHVDLYEGAARAMVSPTSQYLIGYNRVMTLASPFQMNTFSRFSLLPGEELIPRRRHIVGPLLARDPLVIDIGGNDAVRVVPGSANFNVTQVTPGEVRFIRPGDLVWCLPVGSNPMTLALGQLVVYKSVPMAQFVP